VSTAKFKVSVDSHRCVGAGHCVRIVPEVFDQRESDGIVLLLEELPPAELTPYLEKAVRLCPARAIALQDAADDNAAT
jgi:ferredoxin